MPDEKPVSVEDAVRAAASEHNIELTEEKPDSEETEVTSETKVDETKEEGKETPESAQLDARTLKALSILDQLEDTNQGPELIRAMAKHIGLIQDATTKKEAEKKAESAKEKIVAKLGADYPLLAESLGSLINDLLDEQKQEFAHEINIREKARYEAEVDSRVVKFIAENKVSESEQAEITKLSSKFPPSPSVPPEEYLAHQLKVVRWEQKEAKEKSRTNSKIKDNLAESPANRGVAGNEERIVKAPKNMTPLQAVQMAARGETVSED